MTGDLYAFKSSSASSSSTAFHGLYCGIYVSFVKVILKR